MSTFWNELVRRFGAREDIIYIPGAPFITNKYIDYLQKRALTPYLSHSHWKAVLDVGTGIGRWAAYLAQKADHVIGIDISREMIKIAKKRMKGSNADFIVAASYAIPLSSDSINLSLSCTCIQHVIDDDKQQKSLCEMTRVTINKILILELMSSNSSKIKLTHYPTLIVPKAQYISILKSLNIKSISEFGVDFLPFVKLMEQFRNSLFRRLGINVPSYQGSWKQQLMRNSYQTISLFALFFSLPFNKILPNPESKLTRHTLLVVKK